MPATGADGSLSAGSLPLLLLLLLATTYGNWWPRLEVLLPLRLPCSCSDVVLCGITILRGGTFGADPHSELLERSSSPSDSEVALGFPVPGEGFGLLAPREVLGLLRSALAAALL